MESRRHTEEESCSARTPAVAGPVIVAVLVLGACEEDSLPPVVWQGDHIEFRTDEEVADLCDGTLPYLDRHTGYLKELFSSPADLKISYAFIPDDDDLAEYCGDVFACAIEGEVFSPWALDHHEVVHAVRPHMTTVTLEEGLGEYLSDDFGATDPLLADVGPLIEAHVGDDLLKGAAYRSMGYFVGHLIDTHGFAPFSELVSSVTRETSYAEIEATFLDVYGFPLDDVRASYGETVSPSCANEVAWNDDFDCSQGDLLRVDDEAELLFEFDCASADVLGPRSGRIWLEKRIEIPERGRYVLDIRRQDGIGPIDFAILRCGAGCQDVATFPLATPSVDANDASYSTWCAHAGVHTVQAIANADEDGDVSLVVRYLDDNTDDCPVLQE